MSITAFLIIVVVLALATSIGAIWFFGLTLPKHLRERRTALKLWKEQFPQADTKLLREFLGMVATSFEIRSKYAKLFFPYDKLSELREVFTAVKGGVDIREAETLGLFIKKEYGVDLSRFWHRNIDLGDVFTEILKRL